MMYMSEHYDHLTMQQFQTTVLRATDNAGADGAAASSSKPASSAAGQKRSQTSINAFLPPQAPPAAPPAAEVKAAAMTVDSEDDDELNELLRTTADPFHIADDEFQGPPRDIDGAAPGAPGAPTQPAVQALPADGGAAAAAVPTTDSTAPFSYDRISHGRINETDPGASPSLWPGCPRVLTFL